MRVVLLLMITFFRSYAIDESLDDTMAYINSMARLASMQCCTQGVNYARNHTSEDCSSSVPPEVPPAFGSMCIFAMDKCCKDYFDKKKECEKGIETREKCDDNKSNVGKNCCKECIRGRQEGAQGASCEADTSTKNADQMLANDAYVICCKERDRSNDSQNENRSKTSKKNEFTIRSLCEEYAPNELCAHHCIPVPGSYRCECNPGFMLMSDGRNCREVTKNRCKPTNHCQHKCNDNGNEIKCSCRRGYELQADGKSCKDIDECASDPPLCSPDSRCQNILGSYKCISEKKNSEKGTCPPGFSRNQQNGLCDDIDECLLPKPPCPRYMCENTVGGYKCGGKPGEPIKVDAAVPLSIPQEDRCPPGFRSGVNEECEDVDECAIHKDDCNPLSQYCTNTRGSFYCKDKESKHCAPGFKVNPNTNICEDIDECLDSQNLCRADQVCVNVPGAYDCKSKNHGSRFKDRCPEGFRYQVSRCVDIDECVEGTHLCDYHQNCLNTNGTHECHCKRGFELDIATGACVDINECATEQHNCISESQRCDNTVGSFICVRFTSCGTGYILHHTTSKCEDIDECALGMHNCAYAGSNYQCVNLPGSFRCVRKTSSSTTTTTPVPEYEYYYDSEEVEDNKTITETKEDPVVIPITTPKAEAKPEPIPETRSEPIPVVNADPSPEPTEVISLPTTSSSPPTTPPTQSTPSELPLHLPEIPEQPIIPETPAIPDEFPTENNNALDEVNSHSYNEPSYEGHPNSYDNEYSSTPKTEGREEVRHVLLEETETSVTVKGIQNKDGSVWVDTQDIPKNIWTKISPEHESPCDVGYHRNSDGECIDIDECERKQHICSGLSEVCRNTFGGYVCDCAPGFQRDSITNACNLISTSSSTTSTEPTVNIPARTPSQWTNWGFPTYQHPKSRPFRPRSQCDFGYRFNYKSNQCEDIDECSTGVANCASVERCINTEGGYKCECPINWKLDEIRHKCIPIRHGDSFPAGYGNTPESFNVNNEKNTVYTHGNKYVDPTLTKLGDKGELLKCPWGYWLNDDNRCVDTDECSLGIGNCGLTQICTNLPGGYTCNCPPGHNLVSNNTCEDVDECQLAGNRSICSIHADCINTIGSYHCKCHKGFRSAPANDEVCVDVDECAESRPGTLCEQGCSNVWGSYRCNCHRGYRLNADNRTCSDIDECREFASKNLCVGRCHNEPGSYRCSCPHGYRLSEDKRSCIDIDECETGIAKCVQLNPQTGMNEICTNTRGSYRCNRIICPSGYQLTDKHRCTRSHSFKTCSLSDWECRHKPHTISYNYITFVSNLYIPATHPSLFTMRGPAWRNARMKFELKLIDVNAPPTVKEKATTNSFLFSPSNTEAMVYLVQSLQGPQSIELDLTMTVYRGDSYEGSAVAKLIIFVSEYPY